MLFTSDHGCHFKTRNSEYKRSGHDASIRIPTVLHGSRFSGGHRLGQLVSHVDLAPTLLDAAGLAVPSDMAGRSILPLVEQRETAWPDDVYIQISEAQLGRAVRTRRWKYIVAGLDVDPMEQPTTTHLVEQALYDLDADPYELENLIHHESHRVVADAMRQRLRSHLQDIEDITATIDPPDLPITQYHQRSVPRGEEWA